jgi:hypothetical protein
MYDPEIDEDEDSLTKTIFINLKELGTSKSLGLK